ncbi:hypothetical protein GQ54DRAFT_148513 [Martensiomyces pterosporus]|nr:hypothetical protein GQ54DRAFT_148513 [Martensiomyces pterosporus]
MDNGHIEYIYRGKATGQRGWYEHRKMLGNKAGTRQKRKKKGMCMCMLACVVWGYPRFHLAFQPVVDLMSPLAQVGWVALEVQDTLRVDDAQLVVAGDLGRRDASAQLVNSADSEVLVHNDCALHNHVVEEEVAVDGSHADAPHSECAGPVNYGFREDLQAEVCHQLERPVRDNERDVGRASDSVLDLAQPCLVFKRALLLVHLMNGLVKLLERVVQRLMVGVVHWRVAQEIGQQHPVARQPLDWRKQVAVQPHLADLRDVVARALDEVVDRAPAQHLSQSLDAGLVVVCVHRVQPKVRAVVKEHLANGHVLLRNSIGDRGQEVVVVERQDHLDVGEDVAQLRFGEDLGLAHRVQVHAHDVLERVHISNLGDQKLREDLHALAVAHSGCLFAVNAVNPRGAVHPHMPCWTARVAAAALWPCTR